MSPPPPICLLQFLSGFQFVFVLYLSLKILTFETLPLQIQNEAPFLFSLHCWALILVKTANISGELAFEGVKQMSSEILTSRLHEFLTKFFYLKITCIALVSSHVNDFSCLTVKSNHLQQATISQTKYILAFCIVTYKNLNGTFKVGNECGTRFEVHHPENSTTMP